MEVSDADWPPALSQQRRGCVTACRKNSYGPLLEKLQNQYTAKVMDVKTALTLLEEAKKKAKEAKEDRDKAKEDRDKANQEKAKAEAAMKKAEAARASGPSEKAIHLQYTIAMLSTIQQGRKFHH